MSNKGRSVDESGLIPYALNGWKEGFTSLTGSNSDIADSQIWAGQNFYTDETGAEQKRAGMIRWNSLEVNHGHALFGITEYDNGGSKQAIVASGTSWYSVTSASISALTGVAFTSDQRTHFCQALGNLYGANGQDALAVTSNATTITTVTNGLSGDYPVFFNQRLYMSVKGYPDRVAYSNPYSYDAPTQTFTPSNFGTFNTNLAANPKMNAGFIQLDPGSGLRVTGLIKKSGHLYVSTQRDVWQVDPTGNLNADGSISHSVVRVGSHGTSSGDSMGIINNDIAFAAYDSFYLLGEVQAFQSLRTDSRFADPVRYDARNVSAAGKSTVAFGYFNDQAFFSNSRNTINDRIDVYDNRTHIWTTPRIGQKINCFLDYEDVDLSHKFLAGSSDPANSYVYQMESGSNDDTIPVNASFAVKNSNLGTDLPKFMAFADVYFGLLDGSVDYEVYIDELFTYNGTISFSSGQVSVAGVGSQAPGTFAPGTDYNRNSGFTQPTVAQNTSYRIDLQYDEGHRIYLVFKNNRTGEKCKISRIVYYYEPGSINEA